VGIQVSRMKVPQLWQKWHTMIAHTSRRDSSTRQGMLRVDLPDTLVLARM
jgi:hypothetical protein